MAEEFVEAGAEMAARLHHHRAHGGKVDAEMLEEGGVGALRPIADDDDGDAADLQPGSGAKVHRHAGVEAAAACDPAIGEGAHAGGRFEGLAEAVAAVARGARGEAGADAQRMRLGRQRRVDDAAEGRLLHARCVEGAQNLHGVAGAAAARVVGHIGEGEWGGAFGQFCQRVGDRSQLRHEAVAPFPAGLRQLIGQRLGRGALGARHHNGHAVERRVAIGEATHHRDIGDAVLFGCASLAEIDHLGIRPLRGEHGDGGCHDRQAAMRADETLALQQPQHEVGALRTARPHVDMRVGPIADEGVVERHVFGRDVAVQIVAAHEGDFTEYLAHLRLQGAFRVQQFGGQAGAVQHGVATVAITAQRLQPGAPFGHETGENGVLHRPIRLGHGQHDGVRLPRAGLVHGGDEARHFAECGGRGGAGVVHQVVAAEQAAGFEVVQCGRRRPAVALDGKAQQGDARAHIETPSNSA